MRALFFGALTLLCAAGVTHAQSGPGGPYGHPASPHDFAYSGGYHQFPAYPGPDARVPSGDPTVEPKRYWPGDEFKPKAKPACFWTSADYVAGWVRTPGPKFPLITSTTNPASQRAGALDDPGTVVVFTSDVSHDMFSGMRVEAGCWLDCDHLWSLETSLLWLFPNHERFSAASDANGSPALLRPVFDVFSNSEIAVINALPGNPGVASGRIDLDYRTEMFGLELNGRYNLCLIPDEWHIDLLGGFRYLRLDETLRIQDTLQPLIAGPFQFLDTPLVPGVDTLTDFDTFRTVNKFYGAQVGARMRFEGCWWFANVGVKAAIGATEQDVQIQGLTRLTSLNGATQVAGGGVLALPSNIGNRSQTQFGVVPEGELQFGVKLTPCVHIRAGYSFLYWSQVVRPSTVIDRSVNSALIPSSINFRDANTGDLRPFQLLNGESFWVHTLNLRLAVLF